jgi:beta-galactosidase GanA
MKKVFASLIIIIPIALQSSAAPPASRYREFLFGVDYYPEQWSEQYWEHDAQRMKEIGVNAVRMGEFGWSLMEPRKGIYDFALFDRVMEQQTGPAGQTYLLRSPRPGEMRLWTFQSIAHGADGIIHFRWRTARRGIEEYWSGVLDQDDVPRARFQDFKREGAEINKIKGEIFDSKLVSDIAVIKDYDDEWVYDHQYFTSELHVTWVYASLFQAASELKYNIDFIGPQADFGRYKIIFAPYMILMDEGHR